MFCHCWITVTFVVTCRIQNGHNPTTTFTWRDERAIAVPPACVSVLWSQRRRDNGRTVSQPLSPAATLLAWKKLWQMHFLSGADEVRHSFIIPSESYISSPRYNSIIFQHGEVGCLNLSLACLLCSWVTSFQGCQGNTILWSRVAVLASRGIIFCASPCENFIIP